MTTSDPPPPRATMCLATARRVKKAPSRLTRSTRRHSSDVISTNAGPRPPTPALAKQASTRPSSSTVRASAASTCASSPTSQRSASTRPPWGRSVVAAAAFFASSVPQMQTAAPAAASASVIPRPMPLLPPVTSATLPRRSKGAYAIHPPAGHAGPPSTGSTDSPHARGAGVAVRTGSPSCSRDASPVASASPPARPSTICT